MHMALVNSKLSNLYIWKVQHSCFKDRENMFGYLDDRAGVAD